MNDCSKKTGEELLPSYKTIRQRSLYRIKKTGRKSTAEVRYYQKLVCFLDPKTPFERLVREIAMKFGVTRFQKEAINAIQTEAEEFLVKLFHDRNLYANQNSI